MYNYVSVFVFNNIFLFAFSNFIYLFFCVAEKMSQDSEKKNEEKCYDNPAFALSEKNVWMHIEVSVWILFFL